jgi:hypothetical protein
MKRDCQDLPGSVGQITAQLGVTTSRRHNLETEISQSDQHFARRESLELGRHQRVRVGSS